MATTSVFGAAVRRVEDPRFLTGRSEYVDDIPAPGAATAVRADKRTAGRTAHPSVLVPAHPEGAPDDDADLLLELSRLNDEHEAMLRRWEEDLRAREERLRAAGAGLPDVDGSPVDRDDVAA